MKKIFVLSVCLLGILVSCSSDDEDNRDVLNSSNIVGHWRSTYVELYDYDTNEFIRGGEDTFLNYKLYEDGTCVKDIATGTYKLLGKELDIYVSYYHDFLEKEISSTYNYTVEEFSYNQMKIKESNRYINGYDEYGNTIYIYLTSIYTMERVN